MTTPYFILATGQSNIIGRNVMSWAPNARAKIWNNQPQNDTDVGTAYGALNSGLMGIGPRYAHAIAAADVNKDVYYAEYSRGGMGIECWIGGAQFSLQYSSVGPGKIYVNGITPAAITAMEVNAVDLLGVKRRGTGSNLNVGEFLWLKQGANWAKYRIDSFYETPAVKVSIYCTHMASSGAFTEGAAIQVEFQPRFLTMIENSVPAALAAAGKSTVDILLWWQGESDSYPSVNANYVTEFNFVMSYLAAKPWWSPSTKVIICGINSTANNGLATSDVMNGVLAGLVSGHPEREYCGTASTLPADRWQDTWHLTAQGYMEAGDLLLSAIYAPPAVGSGTPTYSVTPTAPTAIKGAIVTFNVATANVGSATLYWTNAGTTTSSDFADAANSGSFAVTSNAGTISRPLVGGGTLNVGETVVMQIRTGSTAGPIVATSTAVTVAASGGGGGTATITGMSIGAHAVVMDFRTNGAHGFLSDGTPYGLWCDGPPIPYKDASNNTYIPIPHSENYRFQIGDWSNGATWTLQGPTMLSTRDSVEGHYNNRHWIFGAWSEGNNVYCLAHHEWYQTMRSVDGFGGINGYSLFNRRWINGISFVSSTNGGASYTPWPADSSNRLVVIPEPWAIQGKDTHFGFFHPSNIVKEGSYYYACCEQRSLSADGIHNDAGVSLIRTTNVTTPLGWEYWTGTTWQTIDHNYYQGNLSYQKPHRFFAQDGRDYYSPPNNYNSHMGQCLRYHAPSGQWLMFGFSGTTAQNIAYSSSATLANPQFTTLTGIPSPDADVYNSAAARFISVFDEAATDKNFLNIGNVCTVLSTSGAAPDGYGPEYSYNQIRRAQLTITVAAAPGDPTYSVTPSTVVSSEGQTVIYTVTTANVGTATLYWTNSGTTAAADFVDGVNSGSFVVYGDAGTISRALDNDAITESAETIILEIRTGSIAGPIVATAATVTITDAPVSAPTELATCWLRNAANTAWINLTQAAGVRIRNSFNTAWINKTGALFTGAAGPKIRNSTNTGWYGSTAVPPVYPSYGTLLSTYCSGVDKWGTYADGVGGTYTALIAANSVDCGYSPPETFGNILLSQNDLDFRYATPRTSSDPLSFSEITFTVDCSNFFNYATNADDHIVFCLDPTGTADTFAPDGTRKHCGAITRYGEKLFDQGRGFLINRAGSLVLEQWFPGKPVSGPGSPGGFGVIDYGFAFNPLTTTVFTVRIRAGYRDGTYGEKMSVDIFAGTSVGGTLLTGFTASWGWDYTGSHRFCLAGISMGFVPPASTGCVEKATAGPANPAALTISNFSFITRI